MQKLLDSPESVCPGSYDSSIAAVLAQSLNLCFGIKGHSKITPHNVKPLIRREFYIHGQANFRNLSKIVTLRTKVIWCFTVKYVKMFLNNSLLILSILENRVTNVNI